MKAFPTFLIAITTATCGATPMKLAAAQKKNLDTFFSNFSESAVDSFKQGALPDDAMLRFALSHLSINNPKSLKKSVDGNVAEATAGQVDTATVKYFGKKITHHKQQSYSIPQASGEVFTFSQLNTLENAGDSTFKATGTIYATGSGGTPDVHGTPAAWKKADEDVSVAGKFRALIKMEASRYVLIEYTLTEP